MKTLSLVIPVYNAPDLTRAAVAAVPELARTAEACGFALVEAIFVDDGSASPLDLSASGATSCALPTVGGLPEDSDWHGRGAICCARHFGRNKVRPSR